MMPSLKICSVCEESVCFNTVIAVAICKQGFGRNPSILKRRYVLKVPLVVCVEYILSGSEKSSIFAFSKLHGVRTWGIVIRVFAGISWKHGT